MVQVRCLAFLVTSQLLQTLQTSAPVFELLRPLIGASMYRMLLFAHVLMVVGAALMLSVGCAGSELAHQRDPGQQY